MFQKHLFLFQQQRVLQYTRHLSEESQGLLIQLLWIPNVCANDGIEW